VDWGRILDRQEQEWRGHVLVAADPASKPAWFELAPTTAGTSGRVALPSPAQVRVGRSDPPWPTPAEGYLAALAPVTTMSIGTSGTVAEAGPEETAKIVAMVADSLIAVGALPVTSTLLREVSGSDPGWHVQLAYRWGRRARQQAARFRAAEHRRLVVRLPLEHATAVIESVSAHDDLVSIQLYGHPWVIGEYVPMITPCFQVRAVDDAGDEHEGLPGDWRGFPGDEGSGNFWFWPPVASARKSLRGDCEHVVGSGLGRDRAAAVSCRSAPGTFQLGLRVVFAAPSSHRTDCCRSIRRRDGVKGGFVYVDQGLSPVLVVLRVQPPLTPYRRRITIRRQSGGGLCSFRGHPGPGGYCLAGQLRRFPSTRCTVSVPGMA
jgi:hypothetical protein